MKVSGLDRIQKNFTTLASLDGLSDDFLMAVGQRLRKNAFSRMADVSGEMIENTKVDKTGRQKVTVSVNVPYAAYNHQGQRKDGSRVIKKRTPPGQQYFLQKAAVQTVPQIKLDTFIITHEIKKHL